ncbi:hypothetical protein [Marinivivus vitaminiproducens]|uniref:hypothetical protein n=1 Tax=Marinivivus vitaminiproducens TaxID=3035935 RepID=UPI0027A218C3|nr:hypothetical protein P4R82_04445 [Geminicoccaceae bacterium SCSIO 64248]
MFTDYVYAFLIWPFSLIGWLATFALIDLGIAVWRAWARLAAVVREGLAAHARRASRMTRAGADLSTGTIAHLFARSVLVRSTHHDRHLR